MFRLSGKKKYPINKFKFFKTISPFFFNKELYFSGQKKEKSKTCIYKYDFKKNKIISCLTPNKGKRFVSPYLFKYKKEFFMLFENQDIKNKHSQISIAKSSNLTNWKLINYKFIYNKKYSIGSPAIFKNHFNNQLVFFFYKKEKNEPRHIYFFKSDLKLNTNNFKKNRRIHYDKFCNDYAPFILKIKNNYYNFFSRWSGFFVKKGLIFFSKSKDLENWSTPIKVKISEKNNLNKTKIIHYSEPHVTLNYNKLYLYFEECNENGRWTIVKTKLLQ